METISNAARRPADDSDPDVLECRDTLTASGENFRRLVENINDVIYSVDADGTIRYVSPRIEERFGYTPAELVGKNFADLIHPEDLDRVRQAFSDVLQGRIYPSEYRVRTKNGEYRHVRTSSRPISREGKNGGLQGMLTDITERKRVEEALLESDERFRALFDRMPSGVAVYEAVDDGENFVFKDFNQAAERIEGVKKEDLIGRRVTEAFPGVAEFGLLEVLRRAWKTGATEHLPEACYRDERNPGTWRECWVYRLPAGDVVAVYNDTTERRLRDRELSANEEKLRLIAENTLDVIWQMDLSLCFTYVNPAVEPIFGYTTEEFIGTSLQEHCAPEHMEQMGEIISHELANAGTHTGVIFETMLRKNGGQELPVEIHGKILFDADGNPTGLQGVTRDISERKAAERTARERERRLHAIIENIFEAIVVIDREGLIRYVNPAGRRLMDRSEDALIGKPFGFPVTEVRPFEIQILQKGGGLRYADTRVTRIEWEGSPAWLASIRDNTEVRKAQEEREQFNAHLQQVQKFEAIGTLAGGIAHDFNNILSPIIGFTDLAMDRVREDPMAKDCLHQVSRAGERARDLVRQILAFSRQTKTEFVPLVPAPIVREMLKMLRSTLPATIEIRQHIDSERIVLGDATGIHQILMNLCTNAKHAMEENGGVLSVSLRDAALSPDEVKQHPDLEAGGYVHLQVADSGCGIDPVVMEQMFQPYFTTKEKDKGTGLGLAVVQGIVKDHGGVITVKSEIGSGTTFDVYLPCTQRKLEEAGVQKTIVPTGSEHILLVDDEASMVKLNDRILAGLGYRVTTRTSSVEALELFKSKPASFDLILTDMTMPNLTGDRLAAECIRIRPEIPVLLATGFSEKMTEERARQLGIRALLFKPVSKKDLAVAVRTALDGSANPVEVPIHEN